MFFQLQLVASGRLTVVTRSIVVLFFSVPHGFGAQIGFLKMLSQNQACSQRFLCCLWEKPIRISLKISLEWEEKYSCTKAVPHSKSQSNRYNEAKRLHIMADDFYEESVDTEEIEDLVAEILRKFSGKYPQDITDQVFLVIEHDENKLKRYTIFAGQDTATANSWIGRVVKERTGLKVKGICTSPVSKLIKTYSILGR